MITAVNRLVNKQTDGRRMCWTKKWLIVMVSRIDGSIDIIDKYDYVGKMCTARGISCF